MIHWCHRHLDTSVSRTWTDYASLGSDNRWTCVHTLERKGGTGRVQTQKIHLCCHTHSDTSVSWTWTDYAVWVTITDTPVYMCGRSLLWIDKTRVKDKTYIWVSVSWKYKRLKTKAEESTRLGYTGRRGWWNTEHKKRLLLFVMNRLNEI
jgi:hypothetical protein